MFSFQDCSHRCVVDPSGKERCVCNQGYALATSVNSHNGIECQDVDECREFGTCSQGCANQEGGYVCTCSHGYVLDTEDQRTCRAREPEPALIFSTKTEVRRQSDCVVYYKSLQAYCTNGLYGYTVVGQLPF